MKFLCKNLGQTHVLQQSLHRKKKYFSKKNSLIPMWAVHYTSTKKIKFPKKCEMHFFWGRPSFDPLRASLKIKSFIKCKVLCEERIVDIIKGRAVKWCPNSHKIGAIIGKSRTHTHTQMYSLMNRLSPFQMTT